jgi:hypothetical protein
MPPHGRPSPPGRGRTEREPLCSQRKSPQRRRRSWSSPTRNWPPSAAVVAVAIGVAIAVMGLSSPTKTTGFKAKWLGAGPFLVALCDRSLPQGPAWVSCWAGEAPTGSVSVYVPLPERSRNATSPRTQSPGARPAWLALRGPPAEAQAVSKIYDPACLPRPPARPLRYRGRRVVPGCGERAHRQGQHELQWVPSPDAVARVGDRQQPLPQARASLRPAIGQGRRNHAGADRDQGRQGLKPPCPYAPSCRQAGESPTRRGRGPPDDVKSRCALTWPSAAELNASAIAVAACPLLALLLSVGLLNHALKRHRFQAATFHSSRILL